MSIDNAAEYLNGLDPTARRNALLSCCHSSHWADEVNHAAPYATGEALWHAAERAWEKTTEADKLEAFSAHPKIGGDLAALRKKFAATEQAVSAEWSSKEQAGVAKASAKVLQDLSDYNLAYEAKFGFIFIVCATGKSAQQMFDLLEVRLLNTRAQELENAAREQLKITRIRLEKLP